MGVPNLHAEMVTLIAWSTACQHHTEGYFDGLVQEKCNSSVLAMELHVFLH